MNEEKTLDEKTLDGVAGGYGNKEVLRARYRCPRCGAEVSGVSVSVGARCDACNVRMQMVTGSEWWDLDMG